MKFLAVCGSGLGSSFMVEMNIKKVLKELGVTGVEVEHTDVGSAVKVQQMYLYLQRYCGRFNN